MKFVRVILIVMLLGCCALWVASYWKIMWVSSDGLLNIVIQHGTFSVGISKSDYGAFYGLTIDGFTDLSTELWPSAPTLGYGVLWYIEGAFWLPILLLALPLAIPASPWARRRRRAKQGLCIRCGYDLQGTDHEVCPECGDPTSRARQ